MRELNSSRPDAVVICHSKAPNGEELVTMEINLHRFILPEFNTHRVFSRNFSSSRAVPVNKILEQVRNDPAMPVHWGKNQRGMVAEEELDKNFIEVAEGAWVAAANRAADVAEYMVTQMNCHKQIVNRLLEPFMWTKGVVTSTKEGFESFFKLRSHKDAQPEIKALSDAMMKSLEESVPQELEYGDYHLPYIDSYTSLEKAIKTSTSCTAQVSYRMLDGSLEKALKIYDMLNLPENGVYPEDPPHFSPTEHVAKVTNEHLLAEGSGNFNSDTFWQYRKALEQGNEKHFIEG